MTVLLPWADPDQIGKRLRSEQSCRAIGAKKIILRTDPSLNTATAEAHLMAKGRLSQMWRAIRRAPNFDSRVCQNHREKYRSLLSGNFDAYFCFRIESAIWLDSVLDFGKRPFGIVDFDDLESVLFEQTILKGQRHSWFWILKLKHHLRKLRKVERKLTKKWDQVCLSSYQDADRLKRLYNVESWIIPNSYIFADVEAECDTEEIRVLFVGSFTHKPNVAGISWFVNSVWPYLKESDMPKITCTIVGYAPPAHIIAYDQINGISVIADAEELDNYYVGANIVIAPLLQGSGTRIKLVEAAAKCRAIVTTKIGCEGLSFVDNEHVIIADSAGSFSDAILYLAKNKKYRLELAQSARKHSAAIFERGHVEREFVLRFHKVWHTK